ncbi:cupredoxin family copper-binding protein [Candidatus Woesearchaeota archaeon]|nr:cupredoxin family copper-binding protein [Candidatus Woesearchaeota archaeon]
MTTKTLLGIFVLLLLAVACAPKEAAPAAEADVTVRIKDFAFIPEVVTVKEGQTIKWVNDDSAVHTVEANNKAFSSPELYQNDAWVWKADKKGAYEYICGIHPSMKGKVVVE